MITIKKLGKDDVHDVNIPNQPFELFGRMMPGLKNGKWTYEIEEFQNISEMCFPDFPYEIEDDGSAYIGAYDGDKCIGLAIYRRGMFKYLYLDDLKVNGDYRRLGVGKKLIEAGMQEAAELNLKGIYTIGQDNNLGACLFYLKQGFEIGGFDNRAYRGTSQENKADIYFYKDCINE